MELGRIETNKKQLTFRPSFALVFLVVILMYVTFVPIVPFQHYYTGSFTSESSIDSVCTKSLLFFNSFSIPKASTSPVGSTFVVYGTDSITSWLLNFGMSSDAICSYTPARFEGFSILFLFDLLITLALALSVFLFFRGKNIPGFHNGSNLSL